MRTYQPIWEEIKKKNSCIVKTRLSTVSLIKKAVIKEKDMDFPFKDKNKNDPFMLIIRTVQVENTTVVHIHFSLKQRYGIIDKVVTPPVIKTFDYLEL
jgi:hypothetical protein